MRELLKLQEGMDCCLDQRDKELRQLHSQSQADGAQLAALVRKLGLSHLCFSLNFYFLMFLLQFPSIFSLLTYSHSFIPLSADHPRHSR